MVKKLQESIPLYGNPFQNNKVSPAIWDHTASPANQHRWCECLNPSQESH